MSDDSEKEIVFNELTGDIRPVLSDYNIEEVDRGICEDTYENRSILRAHKMGWNLVYDGDGQPTGLIQVLSPEMKQAQSLSSIDSRKAILVDERDPNSDYLTEESLLIEEASDTLVPLWVIGQTRSWIRIRDKIKKEPETKTIYEGAPARCRFIKSDGVRCMLWCTGRKTDDGLCRTHLGTKQNNITGAVQKARQRAYQAAPAAIQILEDMMESAESEQVKLKAATEILDRAGIRGGVEIDAKVEINERPADDIIRERLARLVPTVAKITEKEETLEIEAEVVEDDGN